MTVNPTTGVPWQNIRGVIFDIDGTLYNQQTLRLMMLMELVTHVLNNKKGLQELRILSYFRKVREELANDEADNVLNRQFEMVAENFSTTPEHISEVVEKWIYKKPLRYMPISRFHMVDVFFKILRTSGIKIGIFSDYPIDDKLAALQLRADATCYSLEREINALKPRVLGLEKVISRLSLSKSEIVYIGDRESRDGSCALRLGVPFVLRRGRNFYEKITREFEQSRISLV